MKVCAAVRHPESGHPCGKTALPGCTLCLHHLRRRNVVLWSTYHALKSNRVVRLQALARGWLLRRRLALAGPGVVRRQLLANEDDLETCVGAARVHPMSYVSFEESGKIWWFEFPTLWRWMSRNEHPVNPYTKVPLSKETRIRLRALWRYKRLYENAIPAESGTISLTERIRIRMNVVCQLFEDHGFGWIPPSHFIGLARNQWLAMFHFVNDELDVAMPSSMHRTISMTRLYIRNLIDTAADLDGESFRSEATRMLFLMVLFPKDPYILVFLILSALYRV